MKNYRVEWTAHARVDLDRLADFTLERELAKQGDLTLHLRMIESIEQAMRLLEWAPFTCRRASDDAFLRELVIPFGGTGYVALFEVQADAIVVVAALRHQREDDYLE